MKESLQLIINGGWPKVTSKKAKKKAKMFVIFSRDNQSYAMIYVEINYPDLKDLEGK